MRWLPVVLVGACSFAPGKLPGGGTGDDAGTVDTAMTADAESTDASIDGPPQPPDSFTRAIDIVDAKVSGGPHTDFPVLLTLNETWLRSKANGGEVERADGFDIFFSSDQAGTVHLAHEVETYAPGAGALLVWVKVPSLDAATTFYIHYGDSTITTSQAMPTAVWSTGYELVAHLTSSSDATNKASAVSATIGTATAGKVGLALPFDGATNLIDYGSDTELDDVFAGGGTIEAWLRPQTTGENGFGRIMSKEDANGWILTVDNTNVTSSMTFQHTTGNSTVGVWGPPNSTLNANVWCAVTVVYNKDTTANDPAFFINGVAVTVNEVEAPTQTLDTDAASKFVIGNRPAADRTFDGLLDEVRVSSVSRSAGWIGTQYNNQSDPGSFYTVGNPL